ncbi:MAG: polysaccharide deacetylase family protein [Clostridia bacterium]|nr:polysaccharide deacetylase family protein [Clostridia bacterium]
MNYFHLRFPDGKFKALTISYDDGCKADERFIEVLNKYGLKATLNINSNYIPLTEDSEYSKTRASFKALKEFMASGHELAVHGASHVANGRMTIQDGIANTLLGRRGIENAFNTIIRGMAYPDNGINNPIYPTTKEKVKEYLKDIGICYARSLGGDNDKFLLPDDWYEWMPTAHFLSKNLFDYLQAFIDLKLPSYNAARGAKLFYLWGHSYEFDQKDLWGQLENFCQKASFKDDIWYATNIEIYDYVNAYSMLVFNIDKTICYNPTVITVWFEAFGNVYKIEPGQTLYFNN